ncbi:SpaH/EbpB family LPXTG-anchored major pilin [Corynebacterium pseudodiphtheriticum]|nr:SpaH/EbpB family LPXTG-anchored major pilin [Corynebacterium pseudodiphtheriticum]MDK4242065.1 SpaH/EbpB family LPXTG-anchored major pilin [Corynebacterium pseudodiphtheriticum]
MKYTINTPIPAGDLSKLKITDQLKPQLSLVTGNGDGGPAPKVSFSAGNGTPTEMATDDYTLRTENNTLVVEFTEQGLSKLAEQRNGQPNLQVHVEFYAKVVSLPGPGESITNTAEVEYPNDVTITTDSGDTPENKRPTQTEYANLTITKYTDDQEGDVDLSGAEFNLYRCEAGELLGDPIPVATTPEIDPNFSHADNAATLTTVKSDENSREGIFRGYGVPVRTFAAGSTAAQQYNYCVIETKAPTGFVRNPEIHEVELTGADDEAKLLSVRVENQRDNFLSSLPATGAWGIILVFLVGLGLLARGFYTSRKDGRATA